MHRNAWMGVLAALMLAGCTGSFEVEQTEPIRVQVDGESESSTVRQDREQRFVLAADDEDSVELDVEVRRVSEAPARIVIEVRDEDTDEVLEQQEVTAGGNGSESDTIVQNLFINVQGKDNIVVIATAEEGDADVTVTARQAASDMETDGNIDGGVDVDTGNATDGSGTNTTDDSGTNTTVDGSSGDGSTGVSGDATTDGTTTDDTTTG